MAAENTAIGSFLIALIQLRRYAHDFQGASGLDSLELPSQKPGSRKRFPPPADDYKNMVANEVMVGNAMPFDILMEACVKIEARANATAST